MLCYLLSAICYLLSAVSVLMGQIESMAPRDPDGRRLDC
jgi:hypothetical protein